MSNVIYHVTAKSVSGNSNPVYHGESEGAAILYYKAAVAQGLNNVKVEKHIHSIEYMQFIDGKAVWS